jgi:hypothetical protein
MVLATVIVLVAFASTASILAISLSEEFPEID